MGRKKNSKQTPSLVNPYQFNVMCIIYFNLLIYILSIQTKCDYLKFIHCRQLYKFRIFIIIFFVVVIFCCCCFILKSGTTH